MTPSAENSTKRRRRWPWYAATCALLAIFHAPLLRGLATLLVAEDPQAHVDYALIVGGDRRYDRAAELASAGEVKQVLYIEEPPKRLARLGIQLSWGETCVRELIRRGVPTEKIGRIDGEAKQPWPRARLARAWLESHPAERLLVLCERFDSAGERYVWSRVLTAEQLGRVSFAALRDRRFDETDWHRNRLALRSVSGAFMDLAYFILHGEDDAAPPPWDVDAYERSLP